MTLVRNFDNLKVSYKDPFDFTRLTSYLTDIYGGLKVNRGKVHYYLCMYLYYSEEVIVKV